MKRTIVLNLILLIFISAISQTSFEGLATNSALAAEYKSFISDSYNEAKVQPKSDYKKEIREYYKTRYRSAILRIENDHFLFYSEFDDYLEELKTDIALSNPDYDYDKIKVLLARYSWPNAFSTGDGTIAVNIGLFVKLNNEAQLAFILCHEFAHYLLNHSDKDFLIRFNSINSSEFKRKLEAVKRSDYYQATKLKALLKSNIYSERRHNREYEYEADEIGLSMFLNAGYKIDDAIGALEVLDQLNNKPEDKFSIFSVFDIDSVQYASTSIKIKPELDDDYLDNDKLKTHPDITNRIIAFENTKLEESGELVGNSENFDVVLNKLKVEQIYSQFHFHNVDQALLTALRNEYNGDSSEVNCSAIIVSLEKLVSARKNHNLSKMASKPNEFQSNAANDLSNLIFRIRLKYLNEAFYRYAIKKYEFSLKGEETHYSMLKLAYLAKRQDHFNELRTSFMDEYSKSKYYKEVDYMRY